MTQRYTRAFLLIFLSTVTFYSCERVENTQTHRIAKGNAAVGGLLKVAVPQNPKTFIPSQITDAVSSEIGLHLHCGLLRLDDQSLEVLPGLAESWSVDDAGTSYVFALRKGATFHTDACFGNGSREITAKDFAYSFSRLCASDAAAFESTFSNRVLGADAFHSGESQELTGVTVIDDYKLKIQLLKPDKSFLFVLAQPSTAVVSEKADMKYAGESKVGAGPFKYNLDENGLLLERNPDYFLSDAFGNRLPYIDSLSFKTISTKEEQLAAFFDGEIDVVSGLYLDPVKEILEQHVAEFSGKHPKYVMQRESESVGYESYCIYDAVVKDLGNNFMGYRDFSHVQIEQ